MNAQYSPLARGQMTMLEPHCDLIVRLYSLEKALHANDFHDSVMDSSYRWWSLFQIQ